MTQSARYSLFLITTINLLNYVDRWLISAVIPAMQQDLNLSNTSAGFVMSAFMLGYFVTSPLFGYLADRYNRIRLIVAGTGLWSLATVLSGFGRTGWQIFAARTAVGVGEASTVSSGTALIADLYPAEKRNQAMAYFTAAIPVGSALGFIVGGILEHHFGWRAAFFLAGVPGFLVALLLLAVREPKRGQHDPKVAASFRQPGVAASFRQSGKPQQPEPPKSFRSDLLKLVHNKTYVHAVLGYTAYTFTLGGFASWAAKYLVSVRGVPLTEADTLFGAITVVTGVAGSLLGGYGAAFFLKRKPRGDLWFTIYTTVAAIPFAFAGFLLKEKSAFLTCMALAEFFLFLSQPAINVVIMESVGPFLRATATAFSIFMIHLLGDFISPPLVGFIADRSSLTAGVMILPAALFFAAAFYALCYWEAVADGTVTIPTR